MEFNDTTLHGGSYPLYDSTSKELRVAKKNSIGQLHVTYGTE